MEVKRSQISETNSENLNYHIPVLLHEVVDNLKIHPGGTYVDCTFGGGGHSKAILGKLNAEGKLIAFDQDLDAKKNVPNDERVVFVPYNFRHLKRMLQLHGIKEVDGILADLGVSSHQFNKASRGFSTRFDAEMDMRMDQRQEKTAFDIISTYSEQQLHKLFEKFGEVTNAKTLAKTIVEARKTTSLKTIDAFKAALHKVVRGNPHKYFAQVFQALRIEVNEELEALKEMLQQVPEVLRSGGRVAIITFHSLEDRLVKTFFKNGTFENKAVNPFENSENPTLLKPVHKKPIVPTQEEQNQNPRSRSAKLRVAEKL
ncbi:MAG: 16S rRNA (cytosine(1402)-N(4))-methyltransferase RsmH [Chitinophagaceae bacterium]|nr:16S rRNA (cytosine(1402)-N(4))-methyltransferase RsmH [Chitinophagaceae bacterium]